jgi:hypothetical protein
MVDVPISILKYTSFQQRGTVPGELRNNYVTILPPSPNRPQIPKRAQGMNANGLFFNVPQ